MNEKDNEIEKERLNDKDFEQALTRIKKNVPVNKLCIVLYQLKNKYEKTYPDKKDFIKRTSKTLNKSESKIERYLLIGKFTYEKILQEQTIKAFMNGNLSESKIYGIIKKKK